MSQRSAAGAISSQRAPLIAYCGANGVSLIGSRLTIVAMPWFVLQTTGSAVRTGITGSVEAVAYIIAAFFGGALVDRIGFKRTSVASDLASAVTTALVPLLFSTVGLSFQQLLVIVFCDTLCNAPGGAARQGMFPDLVGMAGITLERANAAMQTLSTFARLVGPALAGLLIAAFGASNVLWLDAASFVASAATIAVGVPRTTHTMPGSGGAGVRHYISELGIGVDFIRRDRLILALSIGAIIANFLGAALFTVILPVYARQVFGSVVGLGLILSGFGLGSLAGTLAYGVVGPRLPRRGVYTGTALLSMVTQWALVGLPSLGLATIILTARGISSGPGNPLVLTIFQERTPVALRGRVFGALTALNTAADPLALALTGYVVDRAGLRATLIGLNTIALSATIWMLATSAFRTMDRIDP